MEKIIRAAVERGATDLHIKAGDVFRARINGELVPLTKQALAPDQTKAIAMRLIPNEEDRQKIDRITDYDCSWGATGVGRFRVNILKQRSSFMIILRVIPFEVPTLEKLGLPAIAARIAESEMGLVLVSGPFGSGKSSAIAALLHHANTHTRRHIVTLENPIEFLHRDIKCSITQREIGVDTASLRSGLQAALRQDTDVVVMENLRDAETLEFALQSVERARLVISSLVARDVQSTIEALLALSPEQDEGIMRARVAATLSAVISLRLVPRADGLGRVLASEVAVLGDELREMIVDPARTRDISSHIESGKGDEANHSFGQDLSEKVASGLVEGDVANAVSAGSRSLFAGKKPRGGAAMAARRD
jgi:twitching motility protein PilT